MRKLFSTYFKIPTKPNKNKHSASLFELFFDLVFVAFIGAFVHRAIHLLDNGQKEFAAYSFTFIILSLISVILAWRQFTVYSSRYEIPYNFRHRIFGLLIMLGMGIVTTALFIDFGHGHDKFANFNKVIQVTAPGYFLMLLPLGYLHLSVAYKAKNKYEKRKQYLSSGGVLLGALVSTPAVVINTFLNTQVSRWLANGLWALMIIIWWTFSWLSSSMKISVNVADTSLKHLQERIGIIFIVFIGESIVQTVEGSSHQIMNDTVPTVLKLVMMFVILFAWWWWFNDTMNFPDIINHPRKITLYMTSIIIILVALAFSAIGFSGMVSSPSENYPKWMLSIGTGLWAIGNSIIFIALKDYNKEAKVIFPPLLRWYIYLLPFIGIPVSHISIYSSISSSIFLYVIFGISLSLIPTSMFLAVYKIMIKNSLEKSLETIIKKYYVKEEKWIKKEALQYIDKDIHKQYDYDLNHYSKYILDKK